MAEKKVTYLCVVRLLLDSTTALEGLFREYHSSSAVLGKRRLGVTKQPPFGDWVGSSNTRTSQMFILPPFEPVMGRGDSGYHLQLALIVFFLYQLGYLMFVHIIIAPASIMFNVKNVAKRAINTSVFR